MKRTLLAISILALLGSAPAGAQVDVSMYVALGDSTTSGFTHNGLVDCYQLQSWPAVVAMQAGSPLFEMPLVSAPGIPPILELVQLTAAGPVLVESGDPADAFPYNITYPLPYNNLGIPGSTIFDMLFATGDATNLLTGNIDPTTLMFDLILRIPQVLDPGSGELIDFVPVAQAAALQPTFVTFWVGNGDVLGAVVAGTPIDGVTMRPVGGPVGFETLYQTAVGTMVTLMPDADIVLMTVLDVTEVPFATTIPPFLQVPGLGVVPIMGSNGPLNPDDRVTLLAGDLLGQGYGLPLPGFPPLPEDVDPLTGEPGYVLRAEEIATIKAHVEAYNTVITETAAAFGLPVFDAGGVIDRATFGEGFSFGGVNLTADFLTGGLTGYDAIHKNQLGHAIFAAEFIDFLNGAMNAGITPLDLSDIVFHNPCAGGSVGMGIDPQSVSFSERAKQHLLDVFVPELGRMRPARDRRETAAE